MTPTLDELLAMLENVAVDTATQRAKLIAAYPEMPTPHTDKQSRLVEWLRAALPEMIEDAAGIDFIQANHYGVASFGAGRCWAIYVGEENIEGPTLREAIRAARNQPASPLAKASFNELSPTNSVSPSSSLGVEETPLE